MAKPAKTATAKAQPAKKAAPAAKPATRAAAQPAAKAAPAKATPTPPPVLVSKPTASTKPAKAAKTASAEKAGKAVKAEKPRKPKLVRDSFTIPKAEYAVLDELKQRSAKLGAPAKKSELLRAGIKALAAMPDAALRAALGAVPAIKTGRPKAD